MLTISNKPIENGIHIHNLTAFSDSEPPTFPGHLDFDLGLISHPKYGSGHVRGSLGLILPKGSYVPPSAESQEKAVTFLTQWVTAHKVDLGTPEYAQKTFRSAVSFVGHTIEGDVSSPAGLTTVVITAISFLIDDIQEETGIFSQFKGKSSSDGMSSIADTFRDVTLGKYKNFKDVPALDFPLLQPLIDLGYLIHELSLQTGAAGTISDENDPKAADFFKEMFESIEAIRILKDADFMAKCSDQTFVRLRTKDAGFLAYVELAAKDLEIPAQIRSNVLFARMRESFGASAALVNDLLGLHKEMEEETPANLVLRKVKLAKVSLESAVGQVLDLIASEMTDMQVCAEKLSEEFAESDDLAKYVEILRHAVDGQTNWYLSDKSRYKELSSAKFVVSFD